MSNSKKSKTEIQESFLRTIKLSVVIGLIPIILTILSITPSLFISPTDYGAQTIASLKSAVTITITFFAALPITFITSLFAIRNFVLAKRSKLKITPKQTIAIISGIILCLIPTLLFLGIFLFQFLSRFFK